MMNKGKYSAKLQGLKLRIESHSFECAAQANGIHNALCCTRRCSRLSFKYIMSFCFCFFPHHLQTVFFLLRPEKDLCGTFNEVTRRKKTCSRKNVRRNELENYCVSSVTATSVKLAHQLIFRFPLFCSEKREEEKKRLQYARETDFHLFLRLHFLLILLQGPIPYSFPAKSHFIHGN